MTSSYVNNLRLNEMGTGDQSGSWGTVTNTNLELIGEALASGTEGITTNADTHTTTIADGSTDPGRAMHLKYTGTLDSTCTITNGPNTVKKLWFIENGTSGGHDIIVKQGSGAEITIPNSHVKLIYADGAGAGAAMTDALTDLNVPSLFVKNPGTTDDSTANLFLQTAETDITANDVIGKISFQAPNEAAGTDSILVAAAIQAKAEGTFATDNNATTISFMTGASEAAAEKMTLTSGGDLKLVTDSSVLGFGADNDTTLTHTDGTGLTLNGTNKLTFNDTGTYIHSNADGDLDLVSYGTAVDSINLESAGGITLDAGTAGSGIIYEDDGTEMARIHNDSSDVILETKVADKDFKVKGLDDSSVITALTLDMSEAGAATFNSTVTSSALIVADGGTIGSASDTDVMTIASTGVSTFSKAVVGSTDTDTSNTGSVTLDFNTNQNFVLTFTGNVTLANPSTESVGQSGIIVCIQDGTGSRTLSLGTDYETAGGSGITLSTAASAVDIIPYFVKAANSIQLGAVQKAFS